MGQSILFSLAPAVKVYRGNSDCPRTVVIQQMNKPGGGNVFTEATFISDDETRLNHAGIVAFSVLNEGVAVGQTPAILFLRPPGIFRVVLRRVIKDIFVRTLYWNVTLQENDTDNPIIVNVESF